MVSSSRILLQRTVASVQRGSPSFLEMLGVRFTAGDASKILVKRENLPKTTRAFLDKSIAALQNTGHPNAFSRSLDVVKGDSNNPCLEKLVDNLVEELIRPLIQDSRLEVVKQRYLSMEMSGVMRRVRPDLMVSLTDKSVEALLVVENKRPAAKNMTVRMMMKARTQALGQAIAANQQNTWLSGRPNFMVTCVGTHMMFHTGFLGDVSQRVRKGRLYQGTERDKAVVISYGKTHRDGWPIPWDMSVPSDLEDVVGMLAWMLSWTMSEQWWRSA